MHKEIFFSQNYLRQTLGIDPGDDDGRVTPDAEPEALGFPLPQPDGPRCGPEVLGVEDGHRAEGVEQILHLVLAQVGEGQAQLVLGGGHDGGRVQHLLEIVLLVDGGVLVERAVVGGAEHRLEDVLLAELPAHAVHAHGFLVEQKGLPQMGFAWAKKKEYTR